jgi:hypothetical protein
MSKLIVLVNMAFWAFALMWVLNLEKKGCACSRDWRRDYMKYYFIAAILYQILVLSDRPQYLKVAMPVIGLATLFYLYVSLSYITKQRKKECGCSASKERMILFIFSIILIAMVSLKLIKVHRS